MSLLPLRFRSIASRLGISDLAAPDLRLEKITPIVSSHLSKPFERTFATGLDINDPDTIWDLLDLDAVIRLEDKSGQSSRVGISLRSHEGKAYQAYSQGQKQALTEIRSSLKILRYWVFCLAPKHFPTDEEWIDLLYAQIDQPANSVGCQLIPL